MLICDPKKAGCIVCIAERLADGLEHDDAINASQFLLGQVKLVRGRIEADTIFFPHLGEERYVCPSHRVSVRLILDGKVVPSLAEDILQKIK